MVTVVALELEDPPGGADLACCRASLEGAARTFGGGLSLEPETSLAWFDNPAIGLEATIAMQWKLQNAPTASDLRSRIGVDTGERVDAIAVARALVAAANGNQILISQAVDTAVGGLDARGLGALPVPDRDDPVIAWLLTDSRLNIDRRPPRTSP